MRKQRERRGEELSARARRGVVAPWLGAALIAAGSGGEKRRQPSSSKRIIKFQATVVWGHNMGRPHVSGNRG
jgi:hypothetical protein